MVMEIGKVFDEIQKEYTQKMVRWVPHYLDLIDHLSSSYPAHFNPGEVLDLGSGNGNISASLALRFPNANYTLVDASEKMLAEASDRFLNLNVKCQLGLIQNASFPSESFDLIAASFSLHHLKQEDKKLLISNVYQWLRPDAYFSYADLFIHKDDVSHNAFYQRWRQFVSEHGQAEDWEYLSEHYEEYDHPDNLETQLIWLRDLHYREISVTILDGYWVFISAKK